MPSSSSSPIQPSLNEIEVSHTVKMPAGFNLDDFLFSKLYKSVNIEGRRTINEVLQVIFRQRAGENASTYTVHQLFMEMGLSKNKMKNIISKLDERLLKEKLTAAEFDVTCGIRLLQKMFPYDYRKLSNHCQAQISVFRELRNSLSHNYPLIPNLLEPYDEKLNILLERNENYRILVAEIKKLEKKKSGIVVQEVDEIKENIDEKKKEMYVIIEIEKLKIILNNILEDVGRAFEEDITRCKNIVNKNLSDISKAKVQNYDQNTYNEEVERFKRDPVHELITKGRAELKQQYKKLRIANPCPWMLWDQAEKSSVVNFYIDKIYTPLRIEGPKTEIFTDDLLVTYKYLGGKTVLPPALVVSGLAGSGKTSLCLYLLHHWTEGTDEIKVLKDYNLVIFVEMRTMRSNTLEDFLKTQRMKMSTNGIASDDIIQRLNELKLLFIIDGYDEAKMSSQRMVEDLFAKFSEQRILVTTRGEFSDDVRKIATKHNVEYLTVEICGFDSSRIEEFTDKVFAVVGRSSYYCQAQKYSKRDSVEFLFYIRKRAKILERLLELPLTLALMIYMWIDCPETLNRVTTCTSLYHELFCLYQKKLKDRLNRPCPNKTIVYLLLLIGKKAWELILNKETVLSKEDEKEIEEHCRNKGVPKEELMSAFLVYESDETATECKYDYSFWHKTQMEYLAAYYLAEKTEKENLDGAVESFTGSGLNQVILFLVGHFARKKAIESNLDEIFTLLDNADIKSDDFNFWWNLLTESLHNRAFLWEICHNKLHGEKWNLSQNNVVSGLELLIVTPRDIKELTIEIENGIDPYDIKDLLKTMQMLKAKLRDRYKKKPLLTELFFWQHYQAKCTKTSDQLIRTLYPWGHLRDFAGSIGVQTENHEVLKYCYKVRNLRVRIDTHDAQVCLANSLKRISGSIRQLRVMVVLDPDECPANTLMCLTNDKFKGDLELTLPNMSDENKNWVVQVVENLSGEHGCSRLVLDKSTLSFTTVLYLMMNLRDVVHIKLTVESTEELTTKQLIELDKQKKATHMEVNWISS